MGNGRRSGNSVGWGSVLGAGLALVAAGCGLLGLSARHSGRNAGVQVPDSPMFSTMSGTMAAAMGAGANGAANSKSNLHSVLGQMPLIFEPNQGQSDPGVRFLAHGVGYGLLLDSDGAVLAVPTATHSGSHAASLRIKLVDSNPRAVLTGTGPLPGHSNYFLGNDPRKWHSNVPQFAGVRYENIYPGIDLVFYGNRGQLEYDFHVAPGADPLRAQMEFDGARRLELSRGDLILDRGADGRVLFHAPRIYQRYGGREQSVPGGFVLRTASRAGFEIGAYDHSRELIIDPVPEIETYFGGNGSDTFPSIAIDPSGTFIFLAGSTTSSPTSFPLGGILPTQIGPGANVFVAKLSNTQPPSVSYITFLGGTGTDTATGVAVDGSDDAYLVGNTTSTDFPITQSTAYQIAPETKGTQCTSACDSIFVSVLNPTGAAFLNYSSYVSGNGNDVSTGMAIDAKGDVFITGTTTSSDQPSITDAFPATEAPPAAQTAFQTFQLAPLQFFVTKVNTTTAGNASIAYSTYFGGGTPSSASALLPNVGGGIAVDSTGNIYFSGTTNFVFTGSGRPPDFPILNAYQPCLDTPPVTVVTNPVLCTGTTSTTNTDAFVAKLNPNATPGQQLQFSTYLGGTGTDSSTGLAIDSGAANIYITGTTNSTDFIVPTGTGAFQPANTCGTCAYVGRFNNPTAVDMSLTYFSYLGGTAADGVTNGLAISVDTASGALLTGSTTSPTLPVTAGALESHISGPQNAFFARIDTTTVTGQTEVGSYLTYFGGNGMDRGTSVTIDANTNTYFAGDTTSTNLPLANPLQSKLNGPKNDFFVKLGTAADLCMNCVAPTISQPGDVNAGNPVTTIYTLLNNGPDLATDVVVSLTVPSGVTFDSATITGGTCTSQVTNGNVTCTVSTLQPAATATITFVITPITQGNYQTSATASSVFNNDPDPNNNTASMPFTGAAFGLTAGPSSQTIAAGQTAIYTVTLNPVPIYTAGITLSAGNLPNDTTATFAANPLTPNNGPAATKLTLATTARLVPITRLRPRDGRFYAFWLAIPGLAVFGLRTGSKRRRQRVFGALLLCFLFAMVLLQPACKGNTQTTPVSGTPAANYTVTITATSGTLTQTTSVNLTVQ